jgi:hypothetical protein
MSERPVPQPGEFLLYETEDGRTRVECRFVADTLWLPQGGMADLFQTSKQNIAKHLKSIFAEAELDPASVVNQWLTTAADGKSYRVRYYNLDAILAVGYRVRSTRGTQFRRWATERLREYLVKGFTLDDERLKNPPAAGSGVPDRFDELLERIRDIRASERRMYLRVREIFAMAADYSPTMPETTKFFRFIQNKLHFAVTGNFLAFPAVARAIVVFGAGYGWEPLAQADWLRRCDLHYWGDIDTHGFAILAQLRSRLPHAASFLMDRETLLAHRSHWGVEPGPVRHDLAGMTTEEAGVYDDLRFDRLQTGLRLEQERIGYGWLTDHLRRHFATPDA